MDEQNQHPEKGTPKPGPSAPPPLRASDLSGQDKADYELMQSVSANQEAAVGELYDRFGSLVFRMAYQSMPTRSEAEDAVQEIFVRLWRTADRYDPRKAALVTWVMLLTRRHLVDKLRRKRARIKTAMLDDSLAGGIGAWIESTAGDRMARDEHFEALIKKIETLPELQKTVVMRAYLGGQTLRQISDELDTPLGTIKSALSRALVRLRERTEEEIKS
ncbi:MAG: sigma-70 family RNA polymerase sigma factor [Phycisphaerales bacterium]